MPVPFLAVKSTQEGETMTENNNENNIINMPTFSKLVGKASTTEEDKKKPVQTMTENSNENNIINMPTFSKNVDNQVEEDKSLLQKARENIHEKVATDEQLHQEKPPFKQFQDSLPQDGQEAVDMAKSGVENAVQDMKNKFNERIDEGTERAQKHQDTGSDKNILQQQVDSARNAIYEATKSEKVKEREEMANKDFCDRLEYLKKKGASDKSEPILMD